MKNVIKILKEELLEWIEFVFIRYTPGRTGRFLRRLYWRGRLKACSSFNLWPGCEMLNPKSISFGKDVLMLEGCRLYANDGGSIKIGNRASLNTNVYLGASNGGTITLGNDVAIGPNVVMRAANHEKSLKDVPVQKQGHISGTIILEDDVWVGANVVMLPNVRIGKGAVIAAGAVVNKNIPSYSLAAGVPAKAIKEDCRV